MNRNQNPWQSGAIIDCLDDVDVCIVTACMPCLVFAENKHTLHGGMKNQNKEGVDPCLIYCFIMTISACTLQCLYAYSTRTDIRRKYNLEEDPCDDCMTHVFCHLCALCQEHRELRSHPLTVWPMPSNDAGSVAHYTYQRPISPVSIQSPRPQTMTSYSYRRRSRIGLIQQRASGLSQQSVQSAPPAVGYINRPPQIPQQHARQQHMMPRPLVFEPQVNGRMVPKYPDLYGGGNRQL